MFFYAAQPSPPGPPQQQATEESTIAQDHREAERSFWEKVTTDPVATFTLLLVIFTGVLSLVGVFQLWLLLRGETVAEKTADAAKESADVANKTLTASQRPWIFPDVSVGSDLSINDDGAKVTFEYVLKNSGNTPALAVEVYPKLFAFQFGKISGDPPNLTVNVPQTNAAAELAKFCAALTESSEMLAKANVSKGDPIFPGRELRGALNITMPKAEIDAAREQSGPDILSPVLLFCVTYRTPFDNKSHRTGLVFTLVKREPSAAGGLRPFTADDKLIPRELLELHPFPFHSGEAD